jgi:hypothetical protein
MKKLSILFTLAFFAFVISASAQTSTASTDKGKATTEVKSNDGAKAGGCCAYSTKSCKAGSAHCCSHDKSEAKKSSASATKTEAVANEQKTTAVTGSK